MNPVERTFLDCRAGDAALLHAISQADAETRPSGFWARVADDPSLGALQRALAARELFRRHVRPGMSLAEVAERLEGAAWLSAAAIDRADAVGGEAPVRFPEGGSLFIIRLTEGLPAALPMVGAYVAVDRPLEANVFRDALMSRPAGDAARDARVSDVAVFPETIGKAKPAGA